ncbi:hypothetical protein CEXT_104321 [Caerostris extrusa]|uniref:Uncharacterized protein n=1 Tax=Caerostris extrusa TaxID=172846 RepID=A0AAV4N3P6_CAEEX|nr:hypothetical protein CEXT_104321 [Caerostris extrusa]
MAKQFRNPHCSTKVSNLANNLITTPRAQEEFRPIYVFTEIARPAISLRDSCVNKLSVKVRHNEVPSGRELISIISVYSNPIQCWLEKILGFGLHSCLSFN